MNETVSEMLNEITDILREYKLMEKYLIAIGLIAFLIIITTLATVMGEFWATLLIVLVGIPIYTSSSNTTPRPSDKQLSEAVCQRMSICINEAEGGPKILTYGPNGNKALYKKFVSLYPSMASYKLRKLASIKIGTHPLI